MQPICCFCDVPQQKLPNKKYRHLEQQDVCQLCGQHAEDVYHALVACPHALALRQAMREHWVLPSEQDLAKADPDRLMMLIHNKSLEVSTNVFMLFWHTWSIRNKVIHEDICPFIASSVTFLTRYMTSLTNIRQQGECMDSKGKRCAEFVAGNVQRQPAIQRTKYWVPPPQGTFKINVDAAFNQLS